MPYDIVGTTRGQGRTFFAVSSGFLRLVAEETMKKVCENGEESAALVTCCQYDEGAMDRHYRTNP